MINSTSMMHASEDQVRASHKWVEEAYTRRREDSFKIKANGVKEADLEKYGNDSGLTTKANVCLSKQNAEALIKNSIESDFSAANLGIGYDANGIQHKAIGSTTVVSLYDDSGKNYIEQKISFVDDEGRKKVFCSTSKNGLEALDEQVMPLKNLLNSLVKNKLQANYHTTASKQIIKNSMGALQGIDSGTFRDNSVVQQVFTRWDDKSKCLPAGKRANGLQTSAIIKWREKGDASDPQKYIVPNSGLATPQLVQVDYDAVSTPIVTAQYMIGYTNLEIQRVTGAGIPDLIGNKIYFAARLDELGRDQISAMGVKAQPQLRGILNQRGVTTDTTIFAVAPSLQTPTQFQATVARINKYIVYQMELSGVKLDTLVIPYSDYTALGAKLMALDATNPFFTTTYLQYMLDTLKATNPAINILTCPYADQNYNTAYSTGTNGLAQNIWALYAKSYFEVYDVYPYTATGFLSGNSNNYYGIATSAYTAPLIMATQAEVLMTYTY